MRIRYVVLIAFIITYCTVPLCIRFAKKFKILDMPNQRKIHKIAVPLLGSLAIYAGVYISLLFYKNNFAVLLALLFGGTLIMGIGLIEDIRGLSAGFRIFCHTMIAIMMVILGFRVSFVPYAFGLWKYPCEILISLLWIVGLTNAYNYLDGLDGLAAGSAILNLLCFAAILYNNKQYYTLLITASMLGGCLGFIPYNLRKAKLFLGDAGSTFLGFMLACIGLAGHWAKDNIVKIVIPVLILGVPIFDMIFTTIMRIGEGKVKNFMEWLHYSGKDHFHHYLLDLGLQPFGAVVFVYFVNISLGLNAITLSKNTYFEAFLTLFSSAIMFGFIAFLMIIGRRRSNGWGGYKTN